VQLPQSVDAFGGHPGEQGDHQQREQHPGAAGRGQAVARGPGQVAPGRPLLARDGPEARLRHGQGQPGGQGQLEHAGGHQREPEVEVGQPDRQADAERRGQAGVQGGAQEQRADGSVADLAGDPSLSGAAGGAVASGRCSTC
jgi:hypothetical protein